MRTEKWTYDSHGNILTTPTKTATPQLMPSTRYGNLIQVTDALSEITSYTYDIMGNRMSMTDADGNITKYQYDALYRLSW